MGQAKDGQHDGALVRLHIDAEQIISETRPGRPPMRFSADAVHAWGEKLAALDPAERKAIRQTWEGYDFIRAHMREGLKARTWTELCWLMAESQESSFDDVWNELVRRGYNMDRVMEGFHDMVRQQIRDKGLDKRKTARRWLKKEGKDYCPTDSFIFGTVREYMKLVVKHGSLDEWEASDDGT